MCVYWKSESSPPEGFGRVDTNYTTEETHMLVVQVELLRSCLDVVPLKGLCRRLTERNELSIHSKRKVASKI